MKILFPYLARWRSANRSRYHQLLTQLCLLGHEVLVLKAPPIALDDISAQDIPGLATELPLGLTLEQLEVSRPLEAFCRWHVPNSKLLKKGLIAISSASHVRRLIKERSIDVVLLYNLPQIQLLETVNCHVHFDLADDLVGMLKGEIGGFSRFGGLRTARRVLSRMIDRADTVSVASTILKEQIARPALLLPNGVDITELDRAAENLVRQSRPCVGFVGAFEYWVNFDLVLAVARRLPHVLFRLVGGGRRWTDVKNAVSRMGLGNVELPGAVPYERAMALAATMDVCLLPFTREPVSDAACPLKLFEYAALRKPIVSTSTLEVSRIGNGWITFADDEVAFAEAVDNLIAKPAMAADTGEDRTRGDRERARLARPRQPVCRLPG